MPLSPKSLLAKGFTVVSAIPTERIHGVSPDAFQQFHSWTRRFRSEFHERAIELACDGKHTGLITSELLKEAVVLTCRYLADEISKTHGDEARYDGKDVA